MVIWWMFVAFISASKVVYVSHIDVSRYHLKLTGFNVRFPGLIPIAKRKPYMFRHDLSSITGCFLKSMHLIQRKAPLRHVVIHCPLYKTMSCQSLTQVSIRTPDSYHSRSGFSGLLWGECNLPKASGCSVAISVHCTRGGQLSREPRVVSK